MAGLRWRAPAAPQASQCCGRKELLFFRFSVVHEIFLTLPLQLILIFKSSRLLFTPHFSDIHLALLFYPTTGSFLPFRVLI